MTPDELTGLPGRMEFFAHLQSALAQASQHNRAFALIYIDLDHLLQINADYGHVGGDDFILSVSKTLKEVFTGECFSARIGGDEFNVAVSGLSLDEVTELAQSACAAVAAKPLGLSKGSELILQPVSVSAGIAYLPAGETGVTVDELIRRAYEAVLRAKETDRGRVEVYSQAEERDGLTGLLKRAGMIARLDKACSESERGRSSLTVISFDIDEFDAINRQFGRYTGDEVLRRVASILACNFKEPNVVGRIGGDEFIVLLPASRAETAFVLAEEVRKVVEDTPIPIQAGEMRSHLPVHLSGGIAEYPSDGADWHEILRKASEALYRAKQLGRNRICLPASSQMVTKTSHFTQTQLEKLSDLARRANKSEAYLLREALDDLLRKYDR
jgi:diguanylate cyclase (GGDEF)-like protein